MKELEKFRGLEIVVFGAGEGGRFFIHFLKQKGFLVRECFDNDPKKNGMLLWDDVRVCAPYFKGVDTVIAVYFESKLVAADVKRQCTEMGYRHFWCPRWMDIHRSVFFSYKDIADRKSIEDFWYMMMGLPLDIDHPKSFNEKLQWLKLYNKNPLLRIMADKYAVKKYVGDMIGWDKVIPTLGVWGSYEEIDFDLLPDKFVLKCTHDSGTAEIIKSKAQINHEELQKKFREALACDYYLLGREWCYKDIPRRIIAEPLMGEELKDYKVHVFGGKPKLIQVDMGRFSVHKRNIYTPQWEFLDLSILYPVAPELIEDKPAVLDEMLAIAAKLAGDLVYVRVDMYLVEGRIYFGEMTFYHGSGYEPFNPGNWNDIMGGWIQLPHEKEACP